MTTLAPAPPTPRGALLGLLPALLRDTPGTLERLRGEHGDVVRVVAGPPGLRSIS